MGQLSVYDASAGSGKTYTLVYKYLCILFTPSPLTGVPEKEIFKKILAITFTNKAAWEMKRRIISSLEEFSVAQDENSNSMMKDLMRDTGLSFREMKKYADEILSDIYSDYGSFTVCTIDAFTTRMVKSFSRELHLPSSFTIALDSKELIRESIDMLLMRAGKKGKNDENKVLTDVLVDFVAEKIDDGNTWDISSMLEESGGMWDVENNASHMETMAGMGIENYMELKKRLDAYVKGVEKSLSDHGKKALYIINEKVGDLNALTGGSRGISSFFVKSSRGDMSVDAYGKNVNSFLEGKCFSAKATSSQKASIQACAAEINDIIYSIRDLKEKEGETYEYACMFIKPLKKMAMAHSVRNELKEVKNRSNVMLLREFNEIISSHLREEPVPFIYEKIGERYRHYFIDEFQDTSTLQWENIKNLIYDALAGDGSAMIVGDAKQAIYRWRGGESGLFLDLCDKNAPPLPSSQVDVVRLYTNYRSSGVIVDFTNEFFSASRYFLPHKEEDAQHEKESLKNSGHHDDIYRYGKMYYDGNNQKHKKQTSGFVSIQKVNGDDAASRTEAYLSATMEEIRRVVDEDGFSYRDIAVLYRKNDDGSTLAGYLSSHGIPVVTTESLLLKESVYVSVVVAFLKLLSSPHDMYARVSVLRYLEMENHLMGYADMVEFKHRSLSLSPQDFMNMISRHVPAADISLMGSMPLYETVEYIIKSMNMWGKGQDAYLMGILDMVYKFTQDNTASVEAFLEHWEQRKDKESISSPSSADAVQMLTVHRAKGLEYPVVIFPFANWEVKEKEEVWMDVPGNEMFSPLPSIPMKLSDVKKTDIKTYDKYSAMIRLDNLNIFYVAFTRASRQLHVITHDSKRSTASMADVTGMFLSSVAESHDMDTDGRYVYSIGKRGKGDVQGEKSRKEAYFGTIHSSLWQKKLRVSTSWRKMWTDMNGDNPIIYGNSIHDVLSMISMQDDVDTALGRGISMGMVDEEKHEDIKRILTQVVNHPLIMQYYMSPYTAMTEQELITPQGDILRPDRICTRGNEAVVMDYKTGSRKKSHHTQVQRYADVLTEMGYEVTEKLLVYISESGVDVVKVL